MQSKEYERRKALRLCVGCPTGDVSPARPGTTTCQRCASLHAETAAKRKQRRRDNGLCVHCEEPHLPNSQYCEKHRRYSRAAIRKCDAKRRRLRQLGGLCVDCEMPRLPNSQYCEKHRERARRHLHALYRRRLALRQCVKCGGVLASGTLCGKHLAKHLERLRKRYEEAKHEIYERYRSADLACRCCGEHILEFLTTDHINNDGGAHRRQFSKRKKSRGLVSLRNSLREMGWPPIIQLLCWNCNCGKARNDGICPHKGTQPPKDLSATGRRHRRYMRSAARVLCVHYGPDCCYCCGESNPLFLTWDHPNDDGAAVRREIQGKHPTQKKNCGLLAYRRYYRDLGWPVGALRRSCSNCNCGRPIGGVCPHAKINGG